MTASKSFCANCRGDRFTAIGRAAGPSPLPLSQLFANRGDHPFADRDDQAGVLQNRDEFHRCDQTPLRMLPAQQRFESTDFAARDVRLRLVMDQEFTAFQGAAQFGRP